MKNLIEKFLKVCPRSGKIRGIRKLNGFNKLLFPLIGFIALLWILFRVITKPSRINYPCVKAAAPFASGFIVYVGVLLASFLAYFRTKKKIFLSPHLFSIGLLLCGFGGTYFLFDNSSSENVKLPTAYHEANVPMGIGQGIYPGRVVWVHNPDATNENCNPKERNKEWYRAANNNQTVIDKMVSDALQGITGKTSDTEAWDAIFKFHNSTRGKGETGYKKGEIIFIKTNATSSWSGNYNTTDLTPAYSSIGFNTYYAISETSPEIILAVLRQLVNVLGVDQKDIYVGDPLKHIYKHCYDMWYAEFKDVHYLDNSGYENLGREKVQASTTAKITYSDKGTVLKTSSGGLVTEDYLYKILDDCEYLINIPMIKSHKRAGITIFAKNHFGSHTRSDASHLHNGLVAPNEMQSGVTRAGYGLYRVQVDLMMHNLTGKKNLLYLADMLWSTEYEIAAPVKFKMAPFNNDWTSSILISLDPVAIESVGFDILRTEFTTGRGLGTYPQMDGVDDYLHQAADKANWPDSLIYNPNNDSTPTFTSLGVHEHWNDATERKYSRDLGTGEGIELTMIENTTDVKQISGEGIPVDYALMQNFPNPFNPATIINYQIPKSGHVTLKVFDILGKEVATLVDQYQVVGSYQTKFSIGSNKSVVSSGVYIYRIEAGDFSQSRKMVLLK